MATHYEFMKLMTSANVSCLNIHNLNEVVAITHESKGDNTYHSMVLATNEGMACLTIHFQFKNTIYGFCHMTNALATNFQQYK
jgi:hypothetical protein